MSRGASILREFLLKRMRRGSASGSQALRTGHSKIGMNATIGPSSSNTPQSNSNLVPVEAKFFASNIAYGYGSPNYAIDEAVVEMELAESCSDSSSDAQNQQVLSIMSNGGLRLPFSWRKGSLASSLSII